MKKTKTEVIEEQPQQGGSYLRDPATGALTLIEATVPADSGDNAAAGPTPDAVPQAAPALDDEEV